MAKKRRAAKDQTHHESRENLPEPLEQGSKTLETARRIFVWVQVRWGRLAASAAVAVMLLGIVWWAWPEIRERPGIEQLVERIENLTPIPTCSGQNFCVAVAELQNDRDDRFGGAILDAIEHLEGKTTEPTESQPAGEGISSKPGIEVIRIPRVLSVSGNKPRTAEDKAASYARNYLNKSHADLIIWGTVVQVGDKSAPRIWWTTSEKTQASRKLLSPQGVELPEEFFSQLAILLQLAVVTQYTQASAQEGRYVADRLAPFIEKVRALIPQTFATGWTEDARRQVKSLLADSLFTYGDQAGNNSSLAEAIGYYRELSQAYSRTVVPLDWAMTQNNLGNALAALGGGESGTEHLTEAVTAYRAALEELTRERVPLDWAITQNNLGVALGTLGERESGTEHLTEAVTAFRAALEEHTRERVPLRWAGTQENLGHALKVLGERESGISGTEHLVEAVTACLAALEEYTRERAPLDWAATLINLGNALEKLGERESGTEHLTEAVTAYRAALEELTRERVPLYWAMTQNNLGDALETLGERESATDHLTEAVTAFRAALEEYTRERAPLQWALTLNNLGTTLRELGNRTHNANELCEALSGHIGAWRFLAEDSPHYAQLAMAGVKKDVDAIHQNSHEVALSCLQNYSADLSKMGIGAESAN